MGGSVDERGEQDLPLPVQETGGSSLSGQEPFDIMAHQIVQEADPILASHGEDSSAEAVEQRTGPTGRLGLLNEVLHGGHHHIMGTSGTDPERIERVGDHALRILWGDGHDSLYTWDLLRASCPCAACREGTPLRPGSSVRPVELKPVGRYAMAIRWSDGHTTGIFSYDFLRSICPCEACRPDQFTEG